MQQQQQQLRGCESSGLRRTLLAGGAETTGDTALEIVRQEGVEERIKTAIDVGEAGARYLDNDYPRRHG